MIPRPVWKLRRPQFSPAELDGLGLGPLAARVLVARFASAEEAARFATTYTVLPPTAIAELPEAAALAAHHADGGRILVSGDYDADGVLATAILVLWLEQLGARVSWYLPTRTEGYGFGMPALEKAKAAGAGLIIAVDSGTNDIDTCRAAREAGIDVVVLDHHEPLSGRPPVRCLVNPRYHGARAQEYCGAGLAYKLVEEMARQLRRPPPADLVVLAGLATVGDVAPLVGENRYLVKRALELWPQVRLPGLAALRDLLGLIRPDEQAFAYQLAPRLNAPGRLGRADTALALLLAKGRDEAEGLAARLDALNRERLAGVAAAMERAEKVLAKTSPGRVVIVLDPDLPTGLAGVVAGRLADRYGRPVLAAGWDGKVLRGSGRAPEGYDLVRLLSAVGHLFYQYGGHRQAVGFSLQPDKADELVEALERLAPPPRPVVLEVDALLVPERAGDAEAAGGLELLGPFGPGNPQPLFLARRARPEQAVPTRDGEHVRLKLGSTWFIWFGGARRYEGMRLPLDLAYTLRLDDYNGRAEVQGVVQAAAETVTLTRELLARVYTALRGGKLDSDQYSGTLEPAIAALEELELVCYDEDGLPIPVHTSDKKDLGASGVYLAYQAS